MSLVSLFILLALSVFDDSENEESGTSAKITESAGVLQVEVDETSVLSDPLELQVYQPGSGTTTTTEAPGPVAAPEPGPYPDPHNDGNDCPTTDFTLVKDTLLLPGRNYHTAQAGEVFSLEFTQADLTKFQLQFGNQQRRHMRVTISDCAGDLDIAYERLDRACIRDSNEGSFTLRFDDPFKQKKRRWACDLIPDGRTYYLNFAFYNLVRGIDTCSGTCSFFAED